jgi:LPPG:FO 2-phospho-L-lactate transferase
VSVERCVILAGGTGGAKLAAGIQDVLGSGLSVIANTADDIEIAGVDVSPDPDLITYWLSGEIDEHRGWGIKGDTFTVFDRLVRLGIPDWFRLSDRDLATCLYRRVFVVEGGRRTDAQAQIARALGVRAAVLPMCEERVRTRVRTAEGWRDLQRYLVAEHAEAPVEGIEVEGIADASPTPEVLSAIAEAEAIVIGPSNPVISIGPIVSIGPLRKAIATAGAPVVAVSPYVAGRVVKGPTEIFMQAIGRPSTAAGVAALYEGLIDGIVCDPEDPDPAPENVRVLSRPTAMEGRDGRRALAERTLEFASTLRGAAIEKPHNGA